ncbi:MAG TPA: tRNA lysidine(34) synthetase TilS [Ktedonobacteraceae bacterium]|nr:tRNA lysidine(34) synthetase TilS [Ktedonobacteraceae bacterium]
MLETIVTTYIDKHQLLPPSGEVIVAVSGGADSLCLLHLLNQLCGPGKRYPEVRLHAAHLNHKLRGEASDRDAAAVTSIVESWGLPCTSGGVDVAELARAERRSLEDAARSARYRFLREVAQGKSIAVAHHADDQVETLLLHFLRGSGLTGMVGMLPRQQDIIRPLLEVRHAQTVAYCQEHRIEPLEDLSNTDPRFLRNRIRYELVPLLESLNPGFDSTLLRNAGVIGVDVEWLEAQIDACWPDVVSSEQDDVIKLRREALSSLPLSLQRHLLRRVTSHLCGGQSPLEIRHYILIEQLLGCHDRQERTLDLPHALRMVSSFHEVTFECLHGTTSTRDTAMLESQNEKATLLVIPGRIKVQGTPWIATAEPAPAKLMAEVRAALRLEDWSEVWRLLPATHQVVYVDADVAGSFLEIRTRKKGDRMRPLGMQHEKKLQDIFVDQHVARSDRGTTPIFYSTSHCIWLAGVCLDDRARLTSKTQQIVRLAIIKETMRWHQLE